MELIVNIYIYILWTSIFYSIG